MYSNLWRKKNIALFPNALSNLALLQSKNKLAAAEYRYLHQDFYNIDWKFYGCELHISNDKKVAVFIYIHT